MKTIIEIYNLTPYEHYYSGVVRNDQTSSHVDTMLSDNEIESILLSNFNDKNFKTEVRFMNDAIKNDFISRRENKGDHFSKTQI